MSSIVDITPCVCYNRQKMKRVILMKKIWFLVVFLLCCLMLSACSSGGERQEEASAASSPAPVSEASSETEPEPTATPEPTPAAPEKVAEGGKFVVTGEEFALAYESCLWEEASTKKISLQWEETESGQYRLYQGDIDLDISLSFTKQQEGEDAAACGKEEVMDNAIVVSKPNSVNKNIYAATLAKLIQTTNPSLDYIQSLQMLSDMLDNLGEDGTASEEINGITYKLLPLDSVVILSAMTNTSEQPQTSEESSGIDAKALIRAPEQFTEKYEAALSLLPTLLSEDYEITISLAEGEDGGKTINHFLNGNRTNTLVTFTADGLALLSPIEEENDMTTSLLCSAIIMNQVTPSVGSLSDAYNKVNGMIQNLSVGETVTEVVDGITYQASYGESMVFAFGVS